MSEGNKWQSPTFILSVGAAVIEALSKHTKGLAPEPPQQLLLIALYNKSEMTQADLIEATGSAKSSTSRAIRNLGPGNPRDTEAGPGWVEGYPDPMDRRFNMVRLTPQGRNMMDNVIADALKSLAPLFRTK